MIAEEALAIAKSYTKKSLEGQGALKGAPCTIKSITEVDGGQKITFEWTGTSGTKQTSEMTVKNGVSVTGISDKGNGKFTLLLSDGSESDPIQCVKGEDGFSPTATVEKVGKVATITITDKNGTTTATIKDGEGSEGGEANAIDSISVNGVNVVPDENKNVDITVPSIEGLTKDADLATVAKSGNYEDLSNKPAIPSVEGLAKTTDIPTKVSQLENDSNYLSSIPEEYVTETELEAKGYLTEHQDISGKVDKVEGKSLISDTEIARLATVDNYDDTDIKAEIAKKADTTSIPRKVSVLENDSKYQTESDVTTTLSDYATKTYVGEQIANAEHLKREIVTVLPSDTEASDNIIYMLKVESATGNDKYQEYMKIDGTVQMVGDTSVDLTDYAKTVDIPTTVAELSDSADYAKIADVNGSISTLQTDKADASDLTAHTDNADIHVTADDKTLWNTVENKVDKTSIATALDDTVTDEQVASALLAKTELGKKLDKTSIVTELSDASTNDEVVGALTAYNELQKLESANKEQFSTTSGDYITVTDSVDGKLVELGIKGNSFQKTYSGKNLLVYPYTDTTKVDSGVTFTDNGDGSITINGTNTTDNWLYFWLFGSSASEESKRENLYGKQLVVSGLKNAVGSIKLESYYKTTDGKEYWVKPTGNDDDYFTITYPSKSEVALMNLAIVIYPNGVVNNVTVKPMIRLATETDSSYEPYVGGTPSPNPSYPQAINSVGDDGSLVAKSCGKNVLKNINGDSFLHTGITYTKNSDGSISCTGTQTGHSYYPLNDDLKVDFKGKYILSGNTTTNSNEWGYCLFLQLQIEDNRFMYIFNNNPDEVVCDFSQYPTLRRVRPYIRIGKDAPALTNKTVTFYPMLRPYGTDGTYEPYKESTTTIPLSEPLRAIGDVKDEITYQNGKWGVLRRIGSATYDGSDDENWTLGSTNDYNDTTFTTYINSPIKPIPYGGIMWKPIPSVCDRFKQSSIALYPNSIDYECHMVSNSSDEACASFGRLSIRLLKSRVTEISIDAVKAFIASNPFTVNYQLRNPEFESFADQSLPYLSTYDGVTNISNDDALFAEMTVKYPTTDASGVGSQNESRIAELAKDTDDKFDDVNESLGVIGKCKNLLNPTLQTTTQNGVTCTNNGDGTYTLNGTASADSNAEFILYGTSNLVNLVELNKEFRLTGCPNNTDAYLIVADWGNPWTVYGEDKGNGSNFKITTSSPDKRVAISVPKGKTVDNIVFKPMITTDLNAMYDDFVPYTGDGDTLTHDVAELKNDLKPVMLGQFDSSSSGDLSESITNFTYINIVGIKQNGMEIVTEIAPISFLLNGYKYNIGNTGSTFACTDINASVSMNNLASVRVYGIRR